MKTPDAARTPRNWSGLLDRVALFLAVLGFLLRAFVPGATAGTGLNLLIHLIFWIALTVWFAGRATENGALYRFTGFEFAFLAFAIVSLISIQRASFKLPALDHAMAHLSFVLLFVLCVNVLGRETLLSLLFPTFFAIALYALIQYVLWVPAPAAPGAEESIEMARRIRSREVFAVFVGPNQLAAFLALLIPLVAGSLVDARGSGRGAIALRAAAILIGALALALTGSLGGWVSLAGGAATFAALALTRARGRAAVVAVGAAGVAIVVALLLGSPLLSKLSGSHSMAVRAVYWDATGRIVARAPVLGVGLDNWQEHYFQVKSEVQQEAKKAHNDYLQVLAETGVVGLLAFAAIVVLGLRCALVREVVETADPPAPPPALLPAAVGVLFLVTVFVAATLSGFVSLVLCAAWLAAFFLARRTGAPPVRVWTRIGAASGFVALLIHMAVDFDFYEFGLAQAFFVMLALLALLRGKAAEVRLPKSVCWAAAIVLLAVSLPLLWILAPRALAADAEREETRRILRVLEEEGSSNAAGLISDALRTARSAREHNPVDPETYELHARAKFLEWDILQKGGLKDEKTLFEIEADLLQALDNAIRLRPHSSPLHFRKSQYHLLFRRSYLNKKTDERMARLQADEHLRQAVLHQQRAYELYPTFSRNAYLLARLLELTRDAEGARRHYAEALRLSDLAGRELENLDRLKLEPLARARALRAVGKPFESHEVLMALLRKTVKDLPREEKTRRLERWRDAGEDEIDDAMRPMLKDAIDSILRELK